MSVLDTRGNSRGTRYHRTLEGGILMSSEEWAREYVKMHGKRLLGHVAVSVLVRIPFHALLIWFIWGIAQSLHRIAEAAEFSAGLMP